MICSISAFDCLGEEVWMTSNCVGHGICNCLKLMNDVNGTGSVFRFTLGYTQQIEHDVLINLAYVIHKVLLDPACFLMYASDW